MRVFALLIAAMLAAGSAPAGAAPNRCESGLKSLAPIESDRQGADAVCLVPGPAMQPAVRQAQWAPGSCSVPGMPTCINGWVAVCQCFSYGCHYMTTARRC
jgi:hypothetical protein